MLIVMLTLWRVAEETNESMRECVVVQPLDC